MIRGVKAIIVTIGDELLIGQVIDTNSSFIARQLNSIGIQVQSRIAIADRKEQIFETLDYYCGEVDLIILTGGLGPTSDDITKQTLCSYFGGKLIPNEEAKKNVVHLFEKAYKKPITPVNLAQADVPDVCRVLLNHRGSAPGMIFQKKNSIIVSLPGVPHEMEGLLIDLLPILQSEFDLPAIIHYTLVTAGIGESALAERLIPFEKRLPGDIRLAYLPSNGILRLRLSTVIFDNPEKSAIRQQFSELCEWVSPYLISERDEPIEMVLGRLLKEQQSTISTAESCTGGAIAALITSVPGASEYYQGSVVSYSNAIKKNLLGVKDDTLVKYGAVSEEVVKEMLMGLLGCTGTEYGIAVSGIMGPGGGSAEKPVGTVWVAVGNVRRQETFLLHQHYDRKKNIEVTAVMAINLMRKFIEV